MMKAKTRFDTIEYYSAGGNSQQEQLLNKIRGHHPWTKVREQSVVDLNKVKFVALGYYFSVIVTDTQDVIRIAAVGQIAIDHPLLRSNKIIDVQTSFYETYFLFDNEKCLTIGRYVKTELVTDSGIDT